MIIGKIAKRGNQKICGNCRGICVLPTISKIICKVILDRIIYHLYSTIEQAGFRPESSCVDHINTLRIIIEQSAEYRSDLHLVFVDFEKVFDSVDREGLWMTLRRRGTPNKLVSVNKSTYWLSEKSCPSYRSSLPYCQKTRRVTGLSFGQLPTTKLVRHGQK